MIFDVFLTRVWYNKSRIAIVKKLTWVAARAPYEVGFLMNVLIATDDPQTRQNLNKLLQQQEDVTTHTCQDACSLQHQVRGVRPDLVLLDWELTGRPPAALLFVLDRVSRDPFGAWPNSRWTTGYWPGGQRPPVIVLSERSEVEPVAIACGASAFVRKQEASTALDAEMRRLTGR